MTASCARDRARPSPPRWLTIALLLIAIVSPAAAAEPITVLLDQAQLMQLPERAATVVVGNPLIADIAVQPGGLAVITGKGYGATNFIVLDRSGVVLSEKTVEVKFAGDNKVVIVYRGMDRETYSCDTVCSPRVTLGDATDFFNKTLTETTTRDAQAVAAGAKASGH